MLKDITKKYYIRILITALTIFVGAIVANQSIEVPYYAQAVVLLMLLGLVPYAVWNFKKKMKKIAETEDRALKMAQIRSANMMKMILIYVPTMLCSVAYFAEPTESSLGAAIISLLLFVVFAKPQESVE